MKKIVYFLLFALCLPIGIFAPVSYTHLIKNFIHYEKEI